MIDCERCSGTGGILFPVEFNAATGNNYPAQPGPCPDCGGTGKISAIDGVYQDPANPRVFYSAITPPGRRKLKIKREMQNE